MSNSLDLIVTTISTLAITLSNWTFQSVEPNTKIAALVELECRDNKNTITYSTGPLFQSDLLVWKF